MILLNVILFLKVCESFECNSVFKNHAWQLAILEELYTKSALHSQRLLCDPSRHTVFPTLPVPLFCKVTLVNPVYQTTARVMCSQLLI